MKLSVVVPAYKEAKFIEKNINFYVESLKAANCTFEIIVVADGCAETLAAAKNITDPHVTVLSYTENQGKGFAIKYGAERARGEYIAFIDSDAELDPCNLVTYLHMLEDFEADIIVGSKRHRLSRVVYPPSRRFISLAYQLFLRVLFGIKVKDTQVGIKMFHRRVLDKILPLVLVKRFAFDIELLALATHFGFTRVWEAPVNLAYKFSGSNVNLRAAWETLWDTLAVFYRLRLRGYYDKKIKSTATEQIQQTLPSQSVEATFCSSNSETNTSPSIAEVPLSKTPSPLEGEGRGEGCK